MRILLVEFNATISGAERSLLELVQGLGECHELTLACPPGPLALRAAELGVATVPIPASQLTFRLHPLHTPRGLVAMARSSYRLRAVVRRVAPEVVHANSVRAGLLAIPATRGLCPLVVHCRDVLPRGLAGSLVRGALLLGADQVVAISRHVAASLGRGGRRRRSQAVIDNAVDVVRFDPALHERTECRVAWAREADELVLSVIAQITPWKGQDLAIAVLDELRRRGRAALLLVVGEAKFVGPATRLDNRAFKHQLAELVRSLGREDDVRFLGERSDPERILAATDVLLVPSTAEPFGRTIIEAMAMGVPVAATAVGGPPEILYGGVGGRVVPGRDPRAWADAVEELAGWPAERAAAARAAARERYSRERHVGAMLEIYATARSGCSRRSPSRRAKADGPGDSAGDPQARR